MVMFITTKKPFHLTRREYQTIIKPEILETNVGDAGINFNGFWYSLPLHINKMILEKCDLATKLRVSLTSSINRAFVHETISLAPDGAESVQENDIFMVCFQLVSEHVSFRARYSRSKACYEVFMPTASKLKPIEPRRNGLSLPKKMEKYLLKKSAFEAIFNEDSECHWIVGCGKNDKLKF